ncbi:MAG: NADH-quinone oxidoreductase subunit M [Pirellulaceae bacterium]
MNDSIYLLSGIVFLPAFGALVLAFFPKQAVEAIRYFTLAVTAAVLILCVWGFFSHQGTNFESLGEASASMQNTFNQPWIPSFNIEYYMGIDGISFPLVMLTALVSLLAMGASWSITKHVKGYCILFLLLETGMLGVFLALDFFLFYVFWEVMLLPMYFLIGVWGGPRREYAAIKFFLYTLLGSVLMLIAILMLYFNSDMRALARASDYFDGNPNAAVKWADLHASPAVEEALGEVRTSIGQGDSALVLERHGKQGVGLEALKFEVGGEGQEATAILDAPSKTIIVSLPEGHATAADAVAAINDNALLAGVARAELPSGGAGRGELAAETIDFHKVDPKLHTFNLLALAAIGQHTTSFSKTLQIWSFWLLFIGFAIKVPSVPVHTWLPDAHVEAPTPISMILAGVLLKMGGYGIIRICYPICPFGAYEGAFLVCLIGVISMVYGGMAAMAQKDFKRLVAYSSVSHMGYVVLGLGVWSAVAGNGFNPEYWNMGVQGAMFQMIAHGISSAGMFFMVGVVYDRVHHRNLNEFGGLFGKMPVYTALAIGIFFAGLGLPGLCGFIGEVLVVLSVWNYSYALAVISAAVVIITAAYILWALQRVYLGAEYKGPHEEELTEIKPRELAVALPLFVLAIVLGVFPYQTVLRYMKPTIEQQTQQLADWTRDVAVPANAAKVAEADGDGDGDAGEPPAAAQVAPVGVDPLVQHLPAPPAEAARIAASLPQVEGAAASTPAAATPASATSADHP